MHLIWPEEEQGLVSHLPFPEGRARTQVQVVSGVSDPGGPVQAEVPLAALQEGSAPHGWDHLQLVAHTGPFSGIGVRGTRQVWTGNKADIEGQAWAG